MILSKFCVPVWFAWQITVVATDEGAVATQSMCNDVPALPHKKSAGITTMRLSIGRVMSSTAAIPEGQTLKNNCSPFSYDFHTCGASEILIEVKDDDSRIVKTAAYNNGTKNMVCYVQKYSQLDPNYQIFKGEVSQLSVINNDGSLNKFDKVPDFVLTQQGKDFACVYVSPDQYYVFYVSCDKLSGFIAYTQKAIKANLIDSLQDEIDKAINDHGFKSKEFLKIPQTIPITDFDKNCFQ